MRSKAEMLEQLKGMGVKKQFKPFCITEWDSIDLLVKKPVKIVDGDMEGCAIDVYDGQTFRIWTSQVKKASVYARKYALQATFLDGEVNLLVPASLADEVLPAFGAKVKKTKKISPEHLEALKTGLNKFKDANRINLAQKNVG